MDALVLYCSSMTGESLEETSAPVDFVVPGLDGFQFVAWGTRHGVVYVGYYYSSASVCADDDDGCLSSHIRTVLALPMIGGDGAVTHVEYGGGPHALLAAATDRGIEVFRLDRLMYDLVSSQDWLGNGADSVDGYRVCHMERGVGMHGRVLGLSWTHQLDGILVSDAGSRVQMWKISTKDHVSELSLLWETRTEGPQAYMSAGAWVEAPCVTAGASGVYVWWFTDPCSVTCEMLKHPCNVIHVEWSPGTLRRDSLEEEESATLDGDAKDHPAIMTLDEEGCVRIWVEMVVLMQEEISPEKEDGDQAHAGDSCRFDSYFAMTLVINAPTRSGQCVTKEMFCSWVKPFDSMLGHSHTAHSLRSNILWLAVGYLNEQRGSITVSLYAVRGLTAVVVSSFSGGMLASSGPRRNVRSPKKPQVVLWGSYVWDTGLPFNVSRCRGPGRCATLSARMVYGDEFPEVHLLATVSGDDSSSIMSSGICLGTCFMGETLPNSPASIQQSLYLNKSWKGFGQMHAHPVVSVMIVRDHVVSLDVNGGLNLWGLKDTKDYLHYYCSIQLEFKPSCGDAVYMEELSTDPSNIHGSSFVLVADTLVYRILISEQSLFILDKRTILGNDTLYPCMFGDDFCIMSFQQKVTDISCSLYSGDLSLSSSSFMNIEQGDRIVHIADISSQPQDGKLLLLATSFGHIGIVTAMHEPHGQDFIASELKKFRLPCEGQRGDFVSMKYDTGKRLLGALDHAQQNIHVYSIGGREATSCGVFRCPEKNTISSFIWMSEEVVPCMAVVYHDGQIVIVSLSNLSFDTWQVIAKYESVQKSPFVNLAYSHNHLACVHGSCIGMFGVNALGFDATSVCLGRILLKTSGALPLYHPRMLQSFLLSGHIQAFFNILSSYALWLDAFDPEVESFDSTSYQASGITSPKSSGGDDFANALWYSTIFEPYQVPSPATILSKGSNDFTRCLEKLSGMLHDQAINSSGGQQDPPVRDIPGSRPHHESGMLDMSAFGMNNDSLASVAPSHESGMLDMSTFGMNNDSLASVAPSHESGMLDMSAFGMNNESIGSVAPSHESGMIDMSAFGMNNHNTVGTTVQMQKKQEKCLAQAKKVSLQQCKSHLTIIRGLCDKMQALKKMIQDGDDDDDDEPQNSNKCTFGLSQEMFQRLYDGIKGSQEILNSISGDVDEPSLVFLLSLAWSEVESDMEVKIENNNSSKSINNHVYRSIGLKNAAGVSFDFHSSQSNLSKDTRSCGLIRKLGVSPCISIESLIWMSLSSANSKTVMETVSQTLLQTQKNTDMDSWESLRSAGVAFWLRNTEEIVTLLEESARLMFRKYRDPDKVALLYAAVRKISILQGLYRTCNRLREAEFFSRDFTEEKNQNAACKNAFVLLGQHRYSMAATFFILGGKTRDAIEICVHQMEDIQLAILLYKTLGEASADIGTIINEYLSPNDSAGIQFLQHWVQGNLAQSLKSLCALRQPSESIWLLPALFQFILLAPETLHIEDESISIENTQDLMLHLCEASAEILSRNGMQWLSLELDLLASKCRGKQQTNAQRRALSNTCALALLDSPVDMLPGFAAEEAFHERIHHHLGQLEELRSLGIGISCNTVLHMIEQLYETVAKQPIIGVKALETPKSIDSSPFRRSLSIDSQALQSTRSSLKRTSHDEQRDLARMLKKSETFKNSENTPVQIIYPKGVEIFKVDGDTLNSICSCPLLAPDVCGRLVAVSTSKNGILEFATHPDVELCNMEDTSHIENRSPFYESPTNVESSNQGGVFSKFVSQIFDQASWLTDPLEDSSTLIDGDIGLAASAISSRCSNNEAAKTNLTDSKQTVSKMLTSHPHRQLFLSGCKDTGRIKLWQYDGPRPLRLFTPVPYQDLKEIKSNPDMFSFSSTFARSHSLTSKMSHWGKAVDICFSENGERFASIGEGGLVAVWRLSSGFNKHSDVDGATCSEWWHTCMQQHGRSITFVGGGSVVIAASGACNLGNISLWDTSAAKPECAGRLDHHKSTVNRIRTLPGGWLLIAGDDAGNLSVSDIRMLGSPNKKSLLWNVKACRGKIQAIDTISYDASMLPTSRGSIKRNFPAHLGTDCAIVTGGDDGIIRIWNPSDGSLLQQSHQVYHASKAPMRIFASGETKFSITDVTVCDEGIMSTGTDGIVRLFPKL